MITFPDYALDGQPKNRPALFPWVIEVKKAEEVEKMRKSGLCAREVLDLAGRAVKPGITTDEIDRIVHEATIERGAYVRIFCNFYYMLMYECQANCST
jgi:methionyl aminopeptidase